MACFDKSLMENQVLRDMPGIALKAISASLEHISLPFESILSTPNTPIRHVHFLCSGIVLSKGSDSFSIIGREGLVGSEVFSGAIETLYDAVVRVAGSSLRILSSDLLKATSDCEPLRLFLQRYVQVEISERTQSAALTCDFSPLERMARWLLMCHDRVDGDILPLSQTFLKELVGISDATFGQTLQTLLDGQIITSSPGWVQILRRNTLVRAARDAYGGASRYERF